MGWCLPLARVLPLLHGNIDRCTPLALTTPRLACVLATTAFNTLSGTRMHSLRWPTSLLVLTTSAVCVITSQCLHLGTVAILLLFYETLPRTWRSQLR